MDTVFLIDVDNTLLDNDSVIADLRRHLVEAFGLDLDRRYWEIFETQRNELGYADYLGALERYCERARKSGTWNDRAFAVRMLGRYQVPGCCPGTKAGRDPGPDHSDIRRRVVDAGADDVREASAAPA